MCETCLHTHNSVKPSIKQYDPTHTTTLRQSFATEMNRRFVRVAKAVTEAVVEKDVFGLSNDHLITFANTPGQRAFAFATKAEKMQMFLDWLRQVEDLVLLEMRVGAQYGTLAQIPWFGQYVAKAFQKGTQRAQQELKKQGMFAVVGETAEFVYGNPVAVSELMAVFTRAFTDLKDITTSMDAQISRILAQGLIDGQSPITLARMINSAIIGGGESLGMDISYVNRAGNTVTYFMPGKRRAEILARTEIIRAHHLGTIQQYREWEVEGVYVLAEWATATDGRVCPDCASLQGTIWTLDEIETMIPKHPQCRCCAIPYVDTKRTKIGE